jgi:hypothetical protein
MSQRELLREEILTQYAKAPDQLEDVLFGLSESDIDMVRDDGKWTIRQIVHHIVDADSMVKMIILIALGNSGSSYDQTWYGTENAWVETLCYAERDIAPAVAVYRANHCYVEQLVHCLSDAWDSCVVLKHARAPEGQKITVEHLIRGRVHHALHHIEQIRATRQLHGF